MFPPGYNCSGFVGTHALGHMMYNYTLLIPMNRECSTSKARSVDQC